MNIPRFRALLALLLVVLRIAMYFSRISVPSYHLGLRNDSVTLIATDGWVGFI